MLSFYFHINLLHPSEALIPPLGPRLPEQKRKRRDGKQLYSKADQSRRLPQPVEKPHIDPMHEKHIQQHKGCDKQKQPLVLLNV